MTWFQRKKSKPRRKTAPPPRTHKNQKPWDPATTLNRLKLLAAAAAIALTTAAWHYGEKALTQYAANRAETEHTPENIHLVAAPAWMDPILNHELRAIVATHASTNPMDQPSLQHAADALTDSPWITHIDRVQRTPGGHIHVHAQYRHPTAFVQARDGYHLIGPHAVRLPGLYLEHQIAQMNLPLITGTATPPPPAGRTWQGKDLHAALDLVHLLKDKPYLDQIDAFDAASRDPRGRIHLILRTHAGGAVRWGLPPGQEQPIEPGPTTKTMRLATLHQRFGSIDAGGKTVDIFGPAVFVHQPTTQTAHRSH